MWPFLSVRSGDFLELQYLQSIYSRALLRSRSTPSGVLSLELFLSFCFVNSSRVCVSQFCLLAKFTVWPTARQPKIGSLAPHTNLLEVPSCCACCLCSWALFGRAYNISRFPTFSVSLSPQLSPQISYTIYPTHWGDFRLNFGHN